MRGTARSCRLPLQARPGAAGSRDWRPISLVAVRSLAALAAVRSLVALAAVQSLVALAAVQSLAALAAVQSLAALAAVQSLAALAAVQSLAGLAAVQSLPALAAVRSLAALVAVQSLAALPAVQSLAALAAVRSLAVLAAVRSLAVLAAVQSLAALVGVQSLAALVGAQSLAALVGVQSLAARPRAYQRCWAAGRRTFGTGPRSGGYRNRNADTWSSRPRWPPRGGIESAPTTETVRKQHNQDAPARINKESRRRRIPSGTGAHRFGESTSPEVDQRSLTSRTRAALPDSCRR